jgi:iron complex outermembrane receptor protein
MNKSAGGGLPLTLVAAAVLTVGFATSAHSQTPPSGGKTITVEPGLAEIIVTARRREEPLQSVPVSISVVDPANFAKEGIRSATDLVMAVPGLQYQTTSFNGDDVTFALRGQSVTAGTTAAAVIPYFSDVPLQALSTGDLFDISPVQVLRGPQGTLFGRVTDGGAILFYPVKPGKELEGYAQVQLGSYNLREFQGALTLPVNEYISLRLATDITRRVGYTKNVFDGADLDNLSWETVRLGLLIKPFDGLDNYTLLNYNHSKTNGNGTVPTGINVNDAVPFPCCDAAAMQAVLAQQQALGPRKVNIGNDLFYGDGNFFKRRTVWAFNTTTWEASNALTLKNVFGYQVNQISQGGVAGYSGLGFNVSLALPYRNDEQYSDEIQVQGTVIDERLSYTAGGYFEWDNPVGLNENIAYIYDGALSIASSNYTRNRSKAAYAQIGYKIIDGLRLDVGVRHTHDTTKAQPISYEIFGQNPIIAPQGKCVDPASLPPGVVPNGPPCDNTFSGSFSVNTYTFGLDYQISPSVFAYVSLRKGYRPGGINTVLTNNDLTSYKPETDLSREVGLKATYGSGAAIARTNLSLFYDTLSDSQQFEFTTLGNSGNTASLVLNAPGATMKGVELEQTVRLFNALTLNASWAYIDAKWNLSKFHYTAQQLAAACPADPLVTPADPSLICPLSQFPLTAKNVVHASVEYDLPVPSTLGEIQVGGNGFYTTKVFQIGALPGLDQDATPGHAVYNADVTWSSIFKTRFSATLFVNNLTDKVYANTGYAASLAAGTFGVAARQYAPPRMWGVSATYRF